MSITIKDLQWCLSMLPDPHKYGGYEYRIVLAGGKTVIPHNQSKPSRQREDVELCFRKNRNGEWELEI